MAISNQQLHNDLIFEILLHGDEFDGNLSFDGIELKGSGKPYFLDGIRASGGRWHFEGQEVHKINVRFDTYENTKATFKGDDSYDFEQDLETILLSGEVVARANLMADAELEETAVADNIHRVVSMLLYSHHMTIEIPVIHDSSL